MARTWYLVQSKPRNEARALENLLRQGYETYLPLIEVERLQRGKLLKKQEPLFSRYLFLHLEEGNDNWGPNMKAAAVRAESANRRALK